MVWFLAMPVKFREIALLPCYGIKLYYNMIALPYQSTIITKLVLN